MKSSRTLATIVSRGLLVLAVSVGVTATANADWFRFDQWDADPNTPEIDPIDRYDMYECTLAASPEGYPCIAYTKTVEVNGESRGELWYVEYDGSAWQRQLVVINPSGGWISLGVLPTGEPMITLWTGPISVDASIWCLQRNGVAWSMERIVIADIGDIVIDYDFVVDSVAGEVGIIYEQECDDKNNVLSYAQPSSLPGLWDTSTVIGLDTASFGMIAEASLAISASAEAAIGYFNADWGKRSLCFAEETPTGWTPPALLDGPYHGQHPHAGRGNDIAFASDGSLGISYGRVTQDLDSQLMFAENHGGGWDSEVVLDAYGGETCLVFLDGDQPGIMVDTIPGRRFFWREGDLWRQAHIDVDDIGHDAPRATLMSPNDVGLAVITGPSPWECLVYFQSHWFGTGDTNCDDNSDIFDIDSLVLAITDAEGYASTYPDCDISLGDCNGDGTTNIFDISACIDAWLQH